MKLQNIYKSDINRNINGVIKVAEDDERSMEQELSEYIITRELRRHFNTFFTNYERSLTEPTDKIGVWISGFFGSGKSHFLKMLSYILSNKVVAGKHAVDYFSDKFDDPMMFAQVEHCASVPTDTILFNIDSKSSINKDKTAILRVFAKVFYDHLGFYGEDLKVAKLEQFIERSGKTEGFRQKFEEINGASWTDARDTFAFFEDDIVECLVSVLEMSETAARNWFNGTEDADISIEQLVKEIKEYVDSRGRDYRLLFMIDEVGQYIGSDSNLMLNLQTIVEEIGVKCNGQVWVVVTSQEAIDQITKISGDDFSKIQGRFNTRLSLSSSSADEVIKKRILAKNEDAANMLAMNYEKNSAVLKNLFTFNDSVQDMKGYSSETEFVETYPFVPYQFRLMQNVLAQIRKHGNSGKHLSGGERSMLSGFQETAQAIEDRDETALAPFYLFYDTVNTFLESAICRVIDRCQTAADNGNGLEQYDVCVLKLLYLIRYVDDIKANVENIATLMVDTIDADKITMRKQIQGSLDRLMSQNYISRNGDTYTFLTDDEQDVAREINEQDVDTATIITEISKTIFNDLYPVKKFNYGKYNFTFDAVVDDINHGKPSGGMTLYIITEASELSSAGEQTLRMKSKANNEAIVLLESSKEFPYFDELLNSMKIRKYVKSRNAAQLPETIQTIIRGRQQQASAYEKRAKEYIEKAIINGEFYADGEKVEIKAGGAKDKLNKILETLVESVYSKLDLVRIGADSDEEIKKILAREDQQTSMTGIGPNAEALRCVEEFLEIQKRQNLPTSMGDVQKKFQGIPFGWREIDIAALVATLIADQKVTVSYSGSVIHPTDKRLTDYLRRRGDIDKAMVTKREAVSEKTVKNARKFLQDYFGIMDIPTDEERLISFITGKFGEQQTSFTEMLANYKTAKYPDEKTVKNAAELCKKVLSQQKDNVSLLNNMLDMQDDLLDMSEDMEQIIEFFKTQKATFDSARALYTKMYDELDYFTSDNEIRHSLATIDEILKLPKPYKRISELPTLSQSVRSRYAEMLEFKKEEVLNEIQNAMAEIHRAAGEADDSKKQIADSADKEFDAKKRAVNEADTLTRLDAMRPQIENIRRKYAEKIMKKTDSAEQQKNTVTLPRTALCGYATLSSESDIDSYLAELKSKLMSKLEGHDAINII